MVLETSNIKAKMFDILDKYKYTDDILKELEKLKKQKRITEHEYNWAKENYNDVLKMWAKDHYDI